jgi:hypothetical protein
MKLLSQGLAKEIVIKWRQFSYFIYPVAGESSREKITSQSLAFRYEADVLLAHATVGASHAVATGHRNCTCDPADAMS